MSRLHQLFWAVSDSPHFHTLNVRIPNARTLEVGKSEDFTYIDLPDGINFPHGDATLLILPIYHTFSDLLAADDMEWQRALQTKHPYSSQSHGSIIKGQPGIGKTVFLSYILVRRLQQQLVTIYCDNSGSAYVFSGNGVRKVELEKHLRIKELDLDTQSCALVNLGDKMISAPQHFYPSVRRGRVVIATSPNDVHVSTFEREHIASSYCMPTWEWNDLYCSSLLFVEKLPPTPVDPLHNERLREAYSKFRGIPRICFYMFEDGAMTRHESRVQSAINGIESLERFIHSVIGPMPFSDKVSSKLVRIEPIDKTWRDTFTELSSPYIAKCVYDRIHLYQTIVASQTIKNMLSDPGSRGHAGLLFEQAVHRKFRGGISFRPKKLTINAPRRQIDIVKFDDEASGYFHSLEVRKTPRSRSVHPDFHKRYLIPISKNAESVDAVWLSPTATVLFQITVNYRHGLKAHGVTELLREIPHDGKRDVCIVFVVPADDKATENFGVQDVVYPIGAPQENIRDVQAYHQYVYFFDLKKL